MKHPRVLGIACAVGAVALGLVYLTIAGAPARYLAVNAGALAVGLATLFLLDRISAGWHQWAGASIAVMAAALLATALLGREADGAARWVNLAGFAIQPSLVLLPVMLLAFSRTRDATATAGIVVAAAAMALQPDRAMAGMLVLGTGVLAAMRLDRHILAALAASVAGFVATLARADILPATPYVDQILYTSFDVHAAAGAAVLGGSALLLVPAIIGWSRDPAHRATYATFGLVWLAAVMAAALGNYPTPVVGYGGSAVLGYVLSLLALPTVAGDRAGAAIPPARSAGGAPDNHHPIVGIA